MSLPFNCTTASVFHTSAPKLRFYCQRHLRRGDGKGGRRGRKGRGGRDDYGDYDDDDSPDVPSPTPPTNIPTDMVTLLDLHNEAR